MIQENIQATNRFMNALQEAGQLDKRVLAVGIEMNQLYLEYLDELLDSPLDVTNGVSVNLNGKVVKFKSMDDFSAWLAEQI